jgi:hypothetical protein
VDINKIREELINKLNKQLEVDGSEWDSEIKVRGKGSTRFMEDDVYLSEDLSMFEEEEDETKTKIKELMKGKNGIIGVDLWLKEITKLTQADVGFIRQVIDDFAKRYNLLKVYNWGCDDGGIVIFVDGNAVFRNYYSRGYVEYNTFGPETEDEFWNM